MQKYDDDATEAHRGVLGSVLLRARPGIAAGNDPWSPTKPVTANLQNAKPGLSVCKIFAGIMFLPKATHVLGSEIRSGGLR
jgi:hypothetical protein